MGPGVPADEIRRAANAQGECECWGDKMLLNQDRQPQANADEKRVSEQR
jgi:hypothetical protein